MVIDEVGPLELSGKGWYNAIEELTRRSSAVNVWTVRRSLAEKAARRWNVGTVMIIDIGNVTPEDTAELILHTLSRQEQ
jgi:nucleoside-triphosphatase THEP1